MSEVIEKPAAPVNSAKRAVSVQPGQQFAQREQKRQDWVVEATEGTLPEDILDPQYWAHVAAQLQLYDRVEVLLETGEWMAELICTGVGRNWAQMQVLKHYDLAPPVEALAAAARYRVDWKGKAFVVVRIADSQVVQGGFANRNDANAWLSNHERVTAA
jgi:hypothetical protein